MDTNIELSRLKYHFFFRNKTTELEEDRIQTKTKIVKYDFYSVNEAQISDKIKVFPYYFKNYSIIDNYEFINISQLNEKYIEKLNNDKIRYLSFNYKITEFIDFNTFLFDFKTIKLLIFTII